MQGIFSDLSIIFFICLCVVGVTVFLSRVIIIFKKNIQSNKKRIKDNDNNEIYECVYVSHARWRREEWEQIAKEKNIKFIALATVVQFREFQRCFSKNDTCIYISYALEDNIFRGDDFAKILYKEGFKKIYITDSSPYLFPSESWMIYMGKHCPL